MVDQDELHPSPSLTVCRGFVSFYELQLMFCCLVVWAISSFEHHFILSFPSCKKAYLPSTLLGILALTIVQCRIYLWVGQTRLTSTVVVLVVRTYALYQSNLLSVALSCLCFVRVAQPFKPTDVKIEIPTRSLARPWSAWQFIWTRKSWYVWLVSGLPTLSDIHWWSKGYLPAQFLLSPDASLNVHSRSAALS